MFFFFHIEIIIFDIYYINYKFYKWPCFVLKQNNEIELKIKIE